MARGYQVARSDQVKKLPSHAAPLYSDPPLQYRDSWIVNIPFQTDPRVVEQLVPAPLKPRQGKRQDAARLLAEVYGWFTEGSDTSDLQAAKTLLRALTERPEGSVHSS